MIRVTRGDPRDPEAAALLRESHAMMTRRFPAEANHYLSVDALCGPDITFFVANRANTTVGTGALADRGSYGEIKSIFVAPIARGAGVGAAMVRAIEAEAYARSLTCLRLETGTGLNAAIQLYRRAGYSIRGPFNGYRDNPLSIFMEKPLAGRSPVAEECHARPRDPEETEWA